MNTQQQQQLDAALEQTLDDNSLSKEEEKTLRSIITDLADDRQGLAFVRNLAFRKARARIEESPAHVLRWLERVDKMIDNTASPPEHGTASGASAMSGTACAFSPGEQGLGLIQREIRSAKRSLDLCVFTITDDRLTRAILDAHESGIAVRIVTDNDKRFDSGSDIKRMAREGVPTRFDPADDHMHHKFALIDGKRLINGSYNWTRGATRNHENVIVLNDPALIQAFRKEFERLWDAFG